MTQVSNATSTSNLKVQQAMLRLREQRAETVQRIMQKVVDRKSTDQSVRAIDPTGKRGNLIDTVA